MAFKDEMIIWNNRFPIDRWFRKKYNIPFNSPVHRETSFLDQLREYEEDKLFEELKIKTSYEPNTGDFLKEPHFKSEEEKQLYIKKKTQQSFDSFDDELEE